MCIGSYKLVDTVQFKFRLAVWFVLKCSLQKFNVKHLISYVTILSCNALTRLDVFSNIDYMSYFIYPSLVYREYNRK